MPLHGHLETVTAGPRSVTIIPLATVKTELGITDSASDTKLNRLIAAAGKAFAGAEGMRRDFWRATVQEDMPGYGGQLLPLSRWPVESVSAVTLGGSTVTATSYSIAEPRRDGLYSSNGWSRTSSPSERQELSGILGRSLDYRATYVGGYVMPDQVSTWAATTAYAVNVFVEATSPTALFLFEATTAGTSGASEPTWPTTDGGTVVDGTVTWTARRATKLPELIQELSIIVVTGWFRGSLQMPPPGVIAESFDGASIRYASSLQGQMLPAQVSAALAEYR